MQLRLSPLPSFVFLLSPKKEKGLDPLPTRGSRLDVSPVAQTLSPLRVGRRMNGGSPPAGKYAMQQGDMSSTRPRRTWLRPYPLESVLWLKSFPPAPAAGMPPQTRPLRKRRHRPPLARHHRMREPRLPMNIAAAAAMRRWKRLIWPPSWQGWRRIPASCTAF